MSHITVLPSMPLIHILAATLNANLKENPLKNILVFFVDTVPKCFVFPHTSCQDVVLLRSKVLLATAS
jgi:hypothetical protein